MGIETSEEIRKFERGEITRDDLPRMVVQFAIELGELVRLSGALIGSLLSTPRLSSAISGFGSNGNDASDKVQYERIALKVTEAANMLGISRSGLYETIYNREIGVVRFGNRSIRIPRS
jgi:excisionase family DNA binding protein